MMKIIFNPFYDNHVYVDMDAKGSLMGEKYAGGTELVEELRLRTGLTSVSPDPMERTAVYMKAIRETLESASCEHADIFRASFTQDGLGVAMTLLGWRDKLVAQAWRPKGYTKSAKLNALTEIEANFDCPGSADARRELLEQLQMGNASLAGIAIESVLPSDKLPSYYRRLLIAAGKNGAAVSYMPLPEASAAEGTALRAIQEYLLKGTPAKVTPDESIKLHRFLNPEAALKYAAMKNGGMIASRETVMLREMFRAMNLPLPKTTDVSVPQIVKLLPLAFALRKKEIDVNSLLAFLSIEPNPLASLKLKVVHEEKEWYVSLNRELRQHLMSKGGLDNKWFEMLNCDLYNHEGNLLTASKRKAMEFVTHVGASSGTLTKDEILDIVKMLKSWAATDMDTRGELIRYCKFTEMLAEDLKGDMAAEDIIRWLSSAGAPTVRTVMPAEVGAPEVTDSPAALADPTASLWWADCWVDGKSASELDFLSPADIAELGMHTDTGKTAYEAMRYALAVGVSKIKDSLVILTCDKKDGEPVHEHPLLVELQSCCSLKEDKPSEELYNGTYPVDGMPERQVAHLVDKEHFGKFVDPDDDKLLKRGTESYTSLSCLINYPFDYVLRYLLHWEGYGVESMPDLPTVKGTVSHRYVECLLKESGKDIAKAKAIHEAEHKERIEECILEKGAVMYMDENRLEKIAFRTSLKHAVDSLLKFMLDNNLTVEGMEHPIRTTLPVIGTFTGSIDLLLKDEDGNNVVVDMKWSEGKTYNRRLETGNILQLALYKRAMEAEGRPVSALGYFVLPQRKFLTSDTHIPASDVVEYIPGKFAGDHFTMACNSYLYRMAQIRKGVIEDAEGMELADIQYHKDSIKMNLYPLDTVYGDESRKGLPYGTPNLILKGGLE
mgnify:CR=1 FL=1